MIPFMRSLSELMIITQSRERIRQKNERRGRNIPTNHTTQRKREINYTGKTTLGLPEVPSLKRRKWNKSKKAILRFFDELDYNNQIQSSYDLTLLDRQNDYDQHDAA